MEMGAPSKRLCVGSSYTTAMSTESAMEVLNNLLSAGELLVHDVCGASVVTDPSNWAIRGVGGSLWTAAPVLATYIQRCESLRPGSRVLECAATCQCPAQSLDRAAAQRAAAAAWHVLRPLAYEASRLLVRQARSRMRRRGPLSRGRWPQAHPDRRAGPYAHPPLQRRPQRGRWRVRPHPDQ